LVQSKTILIYVTEVCLFAFWSGIAALFPLYAAPTPGCPGVFSWPSLDDIPALGVLFLILKGFPDVDYA
jgi:hypothetical protein